jgi:hypothetical protein
MIRLTSTLRLATLLSLTVTAGAALAQEPIENALGGPVVTCSGAISWTESDSAATTVEPMRLAARDLDGTDRIALFLSEQDFGTGNVWTCMDGACSATRTESSAITVNALRLSHQADLASGEAVYEMTAVFVVVDAREPVIQAAQTSGTGAFICERRLPDSLLATAD